MVQVLFFYFMLRIKADLELQHGYGIRKVRFSYFLYFC
jgi:hypothetical protein